VGGGLAAGLSTGSESSLEHPEVRSLDPSGWSGAAAFSACLLDRRFEYRRINQGWRTYLEHVQGWSGLAGGEHEIEGRHRSFLLDVPADRRERWAAALAAIVAGLLGHFVDQSAEQRPTGAHSIVTTASPSLGPNGTVDGVLCIRYDLTDASQAAANAEQLTRVLEATRRLQHFLGNQLALTLGYVELMTIDPRVPIELRERVDEALRGVVEATETLSKLRLLARFEIPPDDPSITDHPS
jgi:hypothetical protein